jgi:hypothetical protein
MSNAAKSPKKTHQKAPRKAAKPVSNGLTNPANTDEYPYHLKWQESGIEFELHAKNGAFMSRQAWRVQSALAGLNQPSPMPEMPATPDASLPSPVVKAPPIQHAHITETPLTSALPQPVMIREEFSTAHYDEWLNAQQSKPQYVPSKPISTSLKQHAITQDIQHPVDEPSAELLEHMVNKTVAAFKEADPLPPAPPLETPVASVTPAPFEAALHHAQHPTPTAPTEVPIPEPDIFVKMMADLQANVFEKNTSSNEVSAPALQVPPVIQEVPVFTPNKQVDPQSRMVDPRISAFEKSSASFAQWLATTRITTASDTLLLGAYYLKKQQHVDEVSLTEIKDLVREASGPTINHSVMEQALNQRYIEMVPDLTGLSTKMAYRLTHVGQRYAESLYTQKVSG